MTTITDPTTLAWVCDHYPQRVQRLFEHLNLDLPALSVVKIAVAARDWVAASAALLAYYRTCPSGQWLRHEPVAPGEATDPYAEKITHDIFGIPVPRLPSGGLDWAYVPPGGDPDWAHDLNRHDYMSSVLAAYFATGNRAYVRCLDAHLHDWTTVAEHPGTHGSACPWGNNLDVGHRGKVWPTVFYGLQQEDGFSPATRLLVLCQALDHAVYLRELHGRGSNWVITEMSGLLSLACSWPEFRAADEWREHALQVAQEELQKQVYPDGVLKELTSTYQNAVLWHMGFFVKTMRGAGIPVAPALMELLESMWNYLAYSVAPNGLSPHNSDSDRSELTGELLEKAAEYHRADWTGIATHGAQGKLPPGLPTILFPWAGQLIMRGSWEADAHWAFFDIGPWGTLHQHSDALHLSVTAFGRDLLVDSGRYTYQNYWGEMGITWRSYFIGAEAHNVILVDGLGQANGPLRREQPIGDDQVIITPEYDYAQAIFAHGFTDMQTVSDRHHAIMSGQEPSNDGVEMGVTHTRAVLYLREVGWIVVDHLDTDRPHRITPLWHFHPDCTVECAGQSVVTVDDGVGNLRIQPVGDLDWNIALVSGREGPDFQGWYSAGHEGKVPNTCACYSAEIPQSATFAWLLLPGKGAVPEAAVTRLPSPERTIHLLLTFPETPPVEVAIRLNDAIPMHLSTGEAVRGHCAVVKRNNVC